MIFTLSPLFLYFCAPKSIAYNVLRIKEVAEGNLGKSFLPVPARRQARADRDFPFIRCYTLSAKGSQKMQVALGLRFPMRYSNPSQR